MRRLLSVVVLMLVTVAAVGALADATPNRPDESRDGSSRLVYDVATRRYRGGEETAALTLWGVCVSTLYGYRSDSPTRVDDGWAVMITPALGEHGRRRLIGCLEDATLDRVLGHVVDLQHSS
jgi:hypothetical protein